MNEDLDSKDSENTPPNLSHIDLEQGEILVRRIGLCLKQNPEADLYILINFGAAPLETIVRELSTNGVNIEHVRITRTIARDLTDNLGAATQFPEDLLISKIGKANAEFLKNIVEQKTKIVLIDDIEFEGKTLGIASALIRSFNKECKITKFPIIKSQQDITSSDDGWPFALFDDLGLVRGFKMPWEDKQNLFVGREIDSSASMKTNPIQNLDQLSVSLKQDLRRVVRYLKRKAEN